MTREYGRNSQLARGILIVAIRHFVLDRSESGSILSLWANTRMVGIWVDF